MSKGLGHRLDCLQKQHLIEKHNSSACSLSGKNWPDIQQMFDRAAACFGFLLAFYCQKKYIQTNWQRQVDVLQYQFRLTSVLNTPASQRVSVLLCSYHREAVEDGL